MAWRGRIGRDGGLGVALLGLVCLVLALAAAALCGASRLDATPAQAGPHAYGCPILPASDPLNQEIVDAPVSPRSAQYIASIGLDAHLHPDFGRDPEYGIPYAVVPANQPKLPMDFTEYPQESNRGPYPVPLNAPVEGGSASTGDRHVLVLQRGACKLYELYNAHPTRSSWQAGSGAVFNLRSQRLRPEGWTSADAAGLPIFPLLVRYPEVHTGQIDHALRVTVPRTQRAYIHPATHFASGDTDASLPPMGLRLRLKASFSLKGFSGQALVILRALKRYGLIVADNGSPWYITGAPSPHWNEASILQMESVSGADFEAVQSGPLIR
ncbi:MAG TPA: hypothetical protein VGP17_07935 [Solirubrobacteraceae bacterium]|nr:hypothetical protein [Solirubrobacteraceae bacterium]